MKTLTKTIYKCEYCSKLYQVKHFCEYHELVCHKNPANERVCLNGCPFLEKKSTTLYYDNPMGGEITRRVELFHCSAKNVFLYTPKTEIKKNYHDTGDDSNEPMVKQCDIYDKTMKEDTDFASMAMNQYYQ